MSLVNTIKTNAKSTVHSIENFANKQYQKFKPYEKTAIKVAKHVGVALGTIGSILIAPLSTLAGLIFGLSSNKPTAKDVILVVNETWDKQNVVGKIGLAAAGGIVGFVAGPCITGFAMGTAFSRMMIKPLLT